VAALRLPFTHANPSLASSTSTFHFFAAFVEVLSFGKSRTYGKNSLNKTFVSTRKLVAMIFTYGLPGIYGRNTEGTSMPSSRW
jgi:hypothetical protein